MTHQARQVRPTTTTIPAALAEVALVDARTSAATGGMGISWWHARVAAGEAPRPVIQQPRMTRWRLADVRAFWAQRAQAGSADASRSDGKTGTSTNAG